MLNLRPQKIIILFYFALMVRKAIPHLFTLSNLFCGCLGVYAAFLHQFNAALFFVCLGVFFDFFDGFLARKLGVESTLGVQLDSMADLMTSGLAPGMIMHQLFLLSGVKSIDVTLHLLDDFQLIFSLAPLAWVAYLIPLGAAVRLAKFNLLTESLPYFRGLPAPACALLIMGLPLLFFHPNLTYFQPYLLQPFTLIVFCFIAVFLMNVSWRMFSFKAKGEKSAYLFPGILLLSAAVLFFFFGVAALSAIILCYLFLSLIKNLLKM